MKATTKQRLLEAWNHCLQAKLSKEKVYAYIQDYARVNIETINRFLQGYYTSDRGQTNPHKVARIAAYNLAKEKNLLEACKRLARETQFKNPLKRFFQKKAFIDYILELYNYNLQNYSKKAYSYFHSKEAKTSLIKAAKNARSILGTQKARAKALTEKEAKEKKDEEYL